MLFGVVFVRKSFVIGSDSFTRADQTHWTLDVGRTAGGSYQDVRDVCLFIPEGNLLDNNSALVLYVQAGSSNWNYRGSVSNATPSEVFPLQWPLNPDGTLPPNAQIGISVEPIADVIGKEQQVLGRDHGELIYGGGTQHNKHSTTYKLFFFGFFFLLRLKILLCCAVMLVYVSIHTLIELTCMISGDTGY